MPSHMSWAKSVPESFLACVTLAANGKQYTKIKFAENPNAPSGERDAVIVASEWQLQNSEPANTFKHRHKL